MSRHVVCRVDELPPGQHRIISVRGRTIGVFNVNGEYHALLNRCPHRAAPLCQGVVTGLITSPAQYQRELTRDGEIVRCPWHGWEFDITDGRSVFNPHRVRTRTYEVFVETAPPGEDEDPDADAAGAQLVQATIGPDDPDPTLETYPVEVEQQFVVLYLGQSKPAARPE
ncbi:MAG: Rieske (2Fe-2S) protein [Chloroflexi bacterium]|nr:Rieske (2Fe-2S) protein [Chloroflexota bacterium]